MGERHPVTQTIKITEVRNRLTTLVNRVHKGEARVLVEKGGIPVAGLVSPEDLRRLDRLDRERAERFRVIDEMREAFRGVPAEEIERETDRILAAPRVEQAAPAT